MTKMLVEELLFSHDIKPHTQMQMNGMLKVQDAN